MDFPERNMAKDLMEGAGVPHPEIYLLLANGTPVSLSYVVQEGDRISAYPYFHQLPVSSPWAVPLPEPLRFLLDVHAGRLAAYLRLLGFDTLYQNDLDDVTLAQIAHTEQRILLTRDVGLLKRNAVVYGYYLRSHEPRRQLLEVAVRYGLWERQHPFCRCLACNGLIEPVDKQQVIEQLPPRTREHFHDFRRCLNCRRVYWKGSHFRRMQEFLRAGLSGAGEPVEPSSEQ